MFDKMRIMSAAEARQETEDAVAAREPLGCYWRAYLEHDTVVYVAFPVRKLTPKGAWVLDPTAGEYKWTGVAGRLACCTRAAALERLKARTRSYLRHSRRRYEEAKRRCRVLGISLGDSNRLGNLMARSSW